MQKERTIETTYTTNPRSMMQVQIFSCPSKVSLYKISNLSLVYLFSILGFLCFAEPILCCLLDNEEEMCKNNLAKYPYNDYSFWRFFCCMLIFFSWNYLFCWYKLLYHVLSWWIKELSYLMSTCNMIWRFRSGNGLPLA